MQRLARWLPFTLLLSCGQTADRPAQLGMSVLVPQIVLSRLDDQLHLRIFPKAMYTCDAGSGQITRGGVHVTDYPGNNVNPVLRCDATMWPMQRGMFNGEASPADSCFSQTAPAMVNVPSGNYIVLVEGSGASTGTSTRRIILGSGCAEITPMSGQNLSVAINMIEQSDTAGVCGDSDVAGNESCDNGTNMTNCDHCQFPERQVNTTQTVVPKSASIAWAAGQRMVVGFESSDDPYVHVFDPAGLPITTPPAYTADNTIATMRAFEQHNIRLAASASGYAAVWEDGQHGTAFDVTGTFSDYSAPPPPPASAFVNPTSTSAMDRLHPNVAINGTREVFVFEDASTMGIRVSSTSAATPFTAPTADAALVAAGGMGASGAVTPVIAATPTGFVVAWAARGAADLDIFAIRLDMTGTPTGMPMRVNTETSADQDQPAIATNGNDVVIAWRDASGADPTDNQGTTVRWRHLDAMLAPEGNDRIAPTTVAGNQLAPTTAISATGVVLIAWEDASGQIRGRLFHTDGTLIVNRVSAATGDFEVDAAAPSTAVGTGPRHAPAAAFGGSGLFGVVWQDQGLNQIRMRTLRGD